MMQRGNSDPAAEALSEEHQQSRDLQVGNTCTEPKPTMEQLDAQLAEMEDSKHDLRLNIYQIKRERNALVPLHRLPGEIFISILLKVARGIEPGSELEYGRLHILAQVSTYWFDTIIAFPSFWQQLAPYHPPHFRETVLKRNPSGLFDIECVLRDGDTGPRGEKLLSFMKMAASLSQRWKQLAFAGEMTDEIMEFLRTPAPKVDSLLISVWGGIGTGSRMLALGDGRNIRYLDIDHIAIPWSSPRLCGLRAVQIQQLSGILPSLSELHSMLAASPELWWLQLSSWISFDDGTALTSEASSIQIRPIALSLLNTIVLHSIPTAVTLFLLSSITAPSCECVIAQEVPLSLVNNPASASTFAGLINSALKAIPTFLLEFRKDLGVVSMLSQPSTAKTYEWIDNVTERPGLNVHIPTEGLSGGQLGSFLSLLNFPENVELATDINGVEWKLSLSYVGWHRVPKLKVSGALALRAVCEQLANISAFTAGQNRLESLSSTFDPDSVPSDVFDSIARNLVTYVESTCARKDKGLQLQSGPSGEPNHGKLEITIPRILIHRLRGPLQSWDVGLSGVGQERSQEVGEGIPDSGLLRDAFQSLELNE